LKTIQVKFDNTEVLYKFFSIHKVVVFKLNLISSQRSNSGSKLPFFSELFIFCFEILVSRKDYDRI